jgi:ribosome-associated translation inhibitor RaiA
MEIQTVGIGVEIDTAFDAYVKRRIRFALGRFSNRVERVMMTLIVGSESGGGEYKTCRIRVRLSQLPSVVVERVDTDVHALVDHCVGGVDRAVARRLGRTSWAVGIGRTPEPSRRESRAP